MANTEKESFGRAAAVCKHAETCYAMWGGKCTALRNEDDHGELTEDWLKARYAKGLDCPFYKSEMEYPRKQISAEIKAYQVRNIVTADLKE